MKSLTSLLPKFKKDIKVALEVPTTLFPIEPDFSRLIKGLCPLCPNKLRRMKGHTGYYCSAKSHERFYITAMKFNKLTSPNR